MKLLKWLFYILAAGCLIIAIINIINKDDFCWCLAVALFFGAAAHFCDEKMKGII